MLIQQAVHWQVIWFSDYPILQCSLENLESSSGCYIDMLHSLFFFLRTKHFLTDRNSEVTLKLFSCVAGKRVWDVPQETWSMDSSLPQQTFAQKGNMSFWKKLYAYLADKQLMLSYISNVTEFNLKMNIPVKSLHFFSFVNDRQSSLD